MRFEGETFKGEVVAPLMIGESVLAIFVTVALSHNLGDISLVLNRKYMTPRRRTRVYLISSDGTVNAFSFPIIVRRLQEIPQAPFSMRAVSLVGNSSFSMPCPR